MSSYNDSPPDGNQRAVTQRVQEILTRMHQRRQDFQRARQTGQLDERTHLDFQAAVVDCYDELRPFRSRANNAWAEATNYEEAGLDVLPTLIGTRTVQRRSTCGLGRTKVKTTTEPITVEARHLLQISYDIDDIAEEMGFEPAPEQQPDDIDGGVI